MVAVLGRDACELSLYVLAAEVGGHNDDGVLEVDGAALVVGEASVVEHLQEDVEDVGVSLLYLVEEHYGVGFAAHSLGELTALVVAYVSWRRTDESRHAELLLVLAHVDTRHHRLVVEQILGESLRQLGLADTRRAEEDERSDRTLRILQSGTRTSYGVAHGSDSLVLTDYASVKLLLKVQQLLAFALHHARNGYSRPAAHNLGYVVGCHLLAYHGVAALRRLQLVLYLSYVLFESLQSAVAYLSHKLVVALALGALSLELQLLHLLLVLLNLVHQALLALPFSAERLLLVAQFGDVLVELLYLLGVVLALDSLALNLELLQSARNLVELLGHRVALHAQLCSRLVHKVDGLVGQESVGDVTLRKLHGSYAGVVLYTHLVVVLVALLQSAEDRDSRELVRLVDHYGLETTLESLVLLEVFLVLVERSGTDAAQLAARKCRLEDVGSVHGAFATARTYKRVNLVDEENDATV